VTAAICLNEIINAPHEYVNKNPHLVVQFVDWIQCRYLFVRSHSSSQSEVHGGNGTAQGSDTHQRYSLDIPSLYHIAVKLTQRPRLRNVAEIELDKNYTAKGTNLKPVGIPRNAFPISRQFQIKTTDRSLGLSTAYGDAILRETEILDDTEDEADLLFLLSDDESLPPVPITKSKGAWRWISKGKGKREDDAVP
jgi:ubiquitin-conjugating enzyme E2 Q